MKLEQINSYIKLITKIIGGLFGLFAIGFFIYMITSSRPSIEKKKESCFQEKQIDFKGTVDSFFNDNTKGSVYVRLTNGFTFTIPHSHKEGLSIDKGDSIIKAQGKNIYIIFNKYKSLGIDTADFDCNCKNNNCIEAYF